MSVIGAVCCWVYFLGAIFFALAAACQPDDDPDYEPGSGHRRRWFMLAMALVWPLVAIVFAGVVVLILAMLGPAAGWKALKEPWKS